jgi:excisionase family DNA binding protein
MMPLSLSIEETSAVTGLGRTKLYQLINSGDLKARKLGKRTIVLKDDLDAFLASLEAYPASAGEA